MSKLWTGSPVFVCNRIVKEEAIPERWQMSELVPIYKGKGDVLECSSS